MKQKRFSLWIAIVVMGAFLLPAASSTARTQPPAPPTQTTSEQIMALMTAVNAQLEANEADYRLDRVEYLTPDDSGEVGQTVFFNNRTWQLGHHFVPGDPRRGGRTNITYIVDQAEGAVDALTTAQTTAAIDRAMATWEGVNCSTIPITKLPDIPALDLGVVEFRIGRGGFPVPLADITHAGWTGGFFPLNVLAGTFTFFFIDPSQLPNIVFTDIDNNGKADVAFREILYSVRFNPGFTWRINANIDVESVALHEAGHGLSQGHFGAFFRTDENGKFHFAPIAVMNAGYTIVQQNLAGTDEGGHCSIWASWPNN